jgi:hypothetical protein
MGHKFKTSLDYILRPCLNKPKPLKKENYPGSRDWDGEDHVSDFRACLCTRAGRTALEDQA